MPRLFGKIDQPRGIAQQQLAARRQMQPLPVAMKQRNADCRLKLFDARGDIRRHAVKLVRGLYDAAFFHNGFEDLQIGEVHRDSPGSDYDIHF